MQPKNSITGPLIVLGLIPIILGFITILVSTPHHWDLLAAFSAGYIVACVFEKLTRMAYNLKQEMDEIDTEESLPESEPRW